MLSRLIMEARDAGEDIGAPKLLAAYQRARRADHVSMLLATDALDRLFSTANPLVRAARTLGIGAVHRLRPLKRGFMRQAMGLGSTGPEITRQDRSVSPS